MDEIKAFLDKLEDMSKEDIIKGIPDMLEKAKAVGFATVIKELPEMNQVIRDKMAEFEVDEGLELIKQFMPILFDTVKELAEDNEDFQDELEDAEDTAVAMVVEDGDFAITIIIDDGKFDYKMEAVADADLTLKMNKGTMKNFISGETDAMQAYMAGEVKAEGNLTKAMQLRSLFEILGDELGFELM